MVASDEYEDEKVSQTDTEHPVDHTGEKVSQTDAEPRVDHLTREIRTEVKTRGRRTKLVTSLLTLQSGHSKILLGKASYDLEGAIVEEVIVEEECLYGFRVQPKGEPRNFNCIIVGSMEEMEDLFNMFTARGASIYRQLKCGFMNKVDTAGKSWKNRWFTLHSDRLQYFRSSLDAKPAGEIEIGGASEVELVDDVARTFSFCRNGDFGSRVLVMRGNSEECAKSWMAALQAAADARHSKRWPLSLKEGYMWKCNAKMMHWKKRFFVLLEDEIQYFPTRDSSIPAGTIPLPGGAEIGYFGNCMDRRFLFYVAENGDEKGTRKYLMDAKNDRDREDWIDAIFDVLSRKEHRVNLDSIMEGYLMVVQGELIWKRYCILLRDELQIMNKRKATTTKAKLSLNKGAEIQEDVENVTFDENDMFWFAETGDEQAPRFCFVALHSDSRKQWLYALRSLIATKKTDISPVSIKEGYLWKLSPRGGWQKRYCVVLNDKLLYYRKKYDPEPAGEIPLPGAAEVEIVDGHDRVDTPVPTWEFTLAENGDELGTRKFHLRAESEKLRMGWARTLNKLIASKSHTIMEGSIFEGYLFKKGGYHDAYHKRYFILMPDKLLYFKKRADEVAAGEIAIGFEAEVDVIDDGIHEFMFSVARNGDEFERRFMIYAKDANTRVVWVEALKNLISSKIVKLYPGSIKEDYLHISLSGKWRKRFCVLDYDTLTYFTKRDDEKPAGTVSLHQGILCFNPENESLKAATTMANSAVKSSDDKGDLPDEAEVAEPLTDDFVVAAGSIVVEDEEPVDDKAGNFSFQLTSILKLDGGVRLSPKSEVDRSQWMLEISSVLLAKEFPRTTSELRNGYYLVGVSTRFSKARLKMRFLELSSDSLACYKMMGDAMPSKMVTIDSATTVEEAGDSVLIVRDKRDREIVIGFLQASQAQMWEATIRHLVSQNHRKKFGTRLKYSYRQLADNLAHDRDCVSDIHNYSTTQYLSKRTDKYLSHLPFSYAHPCIVVWIQAQSFLSNDKILPASRRAGILHRLLKGVQTV